LFTEVADFLLHYNHLKTNFIPVTIAVTGKIPWGVIMNDLLKKLVEIDKEAQAIDNELKKEKDNLEAEIQKEIQHTQEKYMSQAKLTLDEKVSELRAVAENQWKENQEKQQILRSNLEKQFEENSEKWVNSIVSDVLN